MVTLSGSGGAQVAGEDYTFTCQFIGGEAVTPVYQWLRDDSPLAGETSGTLSFSPLRETDSGGYTCEVTTGSLTGTSSVVTITVVGKCWFNRLISGLLSLYLITQHQHCQLS